MEIFIQLTGCVTQNKSYCYKTTRKLWNTLAS